MSATLTENTPPRPNAGIAALLIPALACAAVLIPEAIAYASLAGIGEARGLASALIGLTAYAVLGRSRYALVAPTSSAAALVGAYLAGSVPGLLMPLVACTGVIFLLAWALNASFVGALISRPVLRGFSWALALSISLAQLPHLLGIQVTARKPVEQLAQLLEHSGPLNAAVVACGVLSLAAWWVLHLFRNRPAWLQPSLLVLVVTAVLAKYFDFSAWGVPLLGHIDWQFPPLRWPHLSGDEWLKVVEMAPALVLVLFAESWGTTRSLALADNESLDPRRELLALGVANLATAAASGLPVGAGFSAAHVNRDSGGRSKYVAVVTAVGMLICLLALPGLLAFIPWPALAAVIVGILSFHWWPRDLIANARFKEDSWLGFVAALAVFLFGTTFGVLLAIALSIFLVLRRFMQPKLVVLGRVPGTTDFVNTANHADAVASPAVMVLRPDEPLFFANADALLGKAATLRASAFPQVLVLSLEMTDSLDSTALESLRDFIRSQRTLGVRVLLARVKDPVNTQLMRVMPDAPETFFSVQDAVTAADGAAAAID